MNPFKACVVQATPVIFDIERTVEKTLALIRECANENPDLILFPESFIPAYPRGLDFGAVVGSRSREGRELFRRYQEASVEVPGTETEKIGKAAREAGSMVAIGITERDRITGSLYCTLLYFSATGELIGKHRKVKPTGTERLIWGEGDGSGLVTVKTRNITIGGLICWENYMPLARMSMYCKGVQVYLAPTADSRDGWQHTMRHIAMEGRCFVLGCNQYVEKKDYPEDLQPLLSCEPDVMCTGGSVIVSPMGETIAGPLTGKEGILIASLDPAEVVRAKMDLDVAGHYNRPDIFRFSADQQPDTIITDQ